MKKILPVLALAAVLVAGTWLAARMPASPADAGLLASEDQAMTINAIEAARPAVVSIAVDDWRVLEYQHEDGTKTFEDEKYVAGYGSGFLISHDGLILTNRHVVEAGSDKAEYRVILQDGKEYHGRLMAADPLEDLAFLKIYDQGLPYLELGDSDATPVGTTVLAIGNVLGKYAGSVTKGIISGKERNLTASNKHGGQENFVDILQTDAQINDGNSGGPLINLEGKVIGVNVAVDRAGDSLGFAIPINDAKSAVRSILERGYLVRSKLGVRYIMIDEAVAKELELPLEEGAAIIRGPEGQYGVAFGSPAMQAGIRLGDVILEINAIKIDKAHDLKDVVQQYQPGDKIGLKVWREGQIFVTEAVLEAF